MFLCCVENLRRFRSKLDFLRIFKVAPKSGQRPCTIVQGIHEKWLGEKSPFLYFFLMHIHVFMLCRKFELISIKIGFLKKFKVALKSGQRPCTIVQGIS